MLSAALALDIEVGGTNDGNRGLGVLNGLGGYGVEWLLALWLSSCGVLRRERWYCAIGALVLTLLCYEDGRIAHHT